MSTRSKEYKALELLGPGECNYSWAARLQLAHVEARREITAHLRKMTTDAPPHVLAAQCGSVAQTAIPPQCGIRVDITVDPANRGAVVCLEVRQADDSSLLCIYSAIPTNRIR
jgi:hypothetical protein